MNEIYNKLLYNNILIQRRSRVVKSINLPIYRGTTTVERKMKIFLSVGKLKIFSECRKSMI